MVRRAGAHPGVLGPLVDPGHQHRHLVAEAGQFVAHLDAEAVEFFLVELQRVAGHGEPEEFELHAHLVLYRPLSLEAGPLRRGEEGPQLPAPPGARAGQSVQAVVEQREAPEEFGAVGLQRVEGAHSDQVLGHRILDPGAQIEIFEAREGGVPALGLDGLEGPFRHLLQVAQTHAQRLPRPGRQGTRGSQAGVGGHARAGPGSMRAGKDQVAGVGAVGQGRGIRDGGAGRGAVRGRGAGVATLRRWLARGGWRQGRRQYHIILKNAGDPPGMRRLAGTALAVDGLELGQFLGGEAPGVVGGPGEGERVIGCGPARRRPRGRGARRPPR